MWIVEFLTPRSASRTNGQSLTNELDMYFSGVAMRTNGKICGVRGRGQEFFDWAIEGFEDPNDPELQKVLKEVGALLEKYSVPLTTEMYEGTALFC